MLCLKYLLILAGCGGAGGRVFGLHVVISFSSLGPVAGVLLLYHNNGLKVKRGAGQYLRAVVPGSRARRCRCLSQGAGIRARAVLAPELSRVPVRRVRCWWWGAGGCQGGRVPGLARAGAGCGVAGVPGVDPGGAGRWKFCRGAGVRVVVKILGGRCCAL